MSRYEIRHGDYVLLNEQTGSIISSTSEVSVLFTVDENGYAIMHKHGNPKWVEKYMVDAVAKYREAGFDQLASEHKMFTGKFPVDALNRLIDTTGYATKFVRDLSNGSLLPEGMDLAL